MAIIKVQNLSKQYKIGGPKATYGTLRESIMNAVRAPFLLQRNGRGAKTIWALKGIDFEVAAGEVVGIVGHNGAGKSTLLKILSRITDPTGGRVELYGRVASLLEVGTGFHPELTGRENVYLSGAIMGMKRAEIKEKFDEIVAFSEVATFIDTPVKRYSTGMYLRLAFGVAAFLQPEILLVDEVLAVGDIGFQKKCLGKMDEAANSGRTVILVSHNMTAIRRLCGQTLWLGSGRPVMFGRTDDVIARYVTEQLDRVGQYIAPEDELNDGPIEVRAVRIISGGEIAARVDARKPFSIEIDYEVKSLISEGYVGVVITTSTGIVVFSACDTDMEEGTSGRRGPGHYTTVCTIPGYLLHIGEYVLGVNAVRVLPSSFEMLFEKDVLAFEVMNAGVGTHFPETRGGVISPRLEWSIQTHAGPQ